MKLNTIFLTLIALLTFSISYAQLISTDPEFPKADDDATFIFNANFGNKALKDFTGEVYVHAGVITNKSTSGSDWKYVQGTWGTTNAPQMISKGNNIWWSDTINIRDFFAVPNDEEILQIAVLFRNADGSKVHRASDGGDIFIDVYKDGLFTNLNLPQNNAIYSINDDIEFDGNASRASDLKLFVNGNEVASQSNAKSLSYSMSASSSGNYTAILEAKDGSDVSRDTINFVVNPSINTAAVPSGLSPGINYTSPTSIALVLYAPYKDYVYVLGDFNNWSVSTDFFMNRTADRSTYWIEIDGLKAGQTYAFQYFIDSEVKVGDPFSELVIHQFDDRWIPEVTYPNLHPFPSGKTSGYATLIEMDRDEYDWEIENFDAPDEDELVVYELLVRDFIERHDYQTLIDTLDYLTNLGINAIELMPVNEFEGNESWGYNPSFHMALDKYYGTPDDFKRFVDECHKRGIAVILDVVYNHAFSQSPLCQMWWDATNFRPSGANPYLNVTAKHDFNVGYDFNHESSAFKEFMKQCIQYWLSEYKIDGYRFDLSKGFTQKNTLGDIGAWNSYDGARVNNLKRIYSECKAVNPKAYLILEHFADNNEERDLANHGFMFWGNVTHEAQEAAMGYNGDYGWGDYKVRGWNNPKLLSYAESHDEERILYKNLNFGGGNGTYNVKDINTALDRMELTWVVFGSMPGAKMIWQFGELGYDFSINENGRTGNKPIRWDYNEASNRRDVYEVYGAINKLRLEHDVFKTRDYKLDVGGSGKRVHLNHSDMNVVALGNFDVTTINMQAGFQKTGWWYEYFSNDSINVTDVNMSIEFQPGEYQLWTDKNLNPKLQIGSARVLSSSVRVYPNPIQNEVFVESTSKPIEQIKLLDVTGKELLVESVDKLNEYRLQTSFLTTGTYFIEVSTSEGSFVQKLIK
jgi:glycosidase